MDSLNQLMDQILLPIWLPIQGFHIQVQHKAISFPLFGHLLLDHFLLTVQAFKLEDTILQSLELEDLQAIFLLVMPLNGLSNNQASPLMVPTFNMLEKPTLFTSTFSVILLDYLQIPITRS